MTPPRIALVAPGFYPALGGVERYSLFMSRIAAGIGELRAFVPRTGDAFPRIGGSPNEFVEGIPIERLPSRQVFGERVVASRVLFRRLKNFRPSLIWTNQPSGTGDLAATFARLNQIPWIATYHADPGYSKFYGRAYAWTECRYLRWASLVIVTTEHYRRKLIDRGISPSRIVQIPAGPYIGSGTLPEPVHTEVDAATPPGPSHPFVFVGGLDRARAYKRPDLLIESVGRIRARGVPVHLWIVGDGNARGQLEALSARAGAEGGIEFLGAVSDGALADRLRNAWALVLPSDSDAEGFGTVCTEAITYGCPVIGSSSAPGPALTASQHAGIAYGPGDAQALDRALEQLWHSPELRKDLSATASRVAQEWAWTSIEPRVQEALHRALGE